MIIFYGTKHIAGHAREFSNGKWQLNPDHYLDLLEQRPGAFDSARPIRQWRMSWPKELEDLLALFVQKEGQTAGVREFISVLKLYREYGKEEVERAVALALDKEIHSSDVLRQMVLHSQPKEEAASPLPEWAATQRPDISVYGELGGVS